jgi:hypothetical protein
MLMIAFLEAILHLVDYPPSHQRVFVQYDEQRGWRNIANAEGDFIAPEYTVHLRYNSRGLRGPERPYTKPSNVYRIVVLGDSFIDGYSVAREDRVTEQLEELLNARQSAKRAEVIALGTAGYSTDQELLWLQSEGLRYQPDLVVLMFYYNDIWYNAQARYWRGAKPQFIDEGATLRLTNVPVPFPCSSLGSLKAWVRTHSRLCILAHRAIENSPWLRAAAMKAGRVSRPGNASTASKGGAPLLQELSVFRKVPSPEVERAWVITRALLHEMRSTVTAHGGRFMTFYIPRRRRVGPRRSAQALSGRLHT